MPQGNGLEVLQRLRSISNMTPTGNAYLDKRRGQIATGEDELAPSDLEQLQTQLALDKEGVSVSRDQVRDAGIQQLKQRLGLMGRQHQMDMEKETAPEIIRGEYGVRSAEAAARAAADRLKFSADATAGRQEDNQRAIMERLDKTQGGLNTRQEDNQQFKVEHPNAGATTMVPAQLYDAVNKARAAMPGNPLTKLLNGKSANAALEGALANVLDRKGTIKFMPDVLSRLQGVQGGSIDERIQATGDPAMQNLDPYERQYLALKLGL
jgi:hypothetical protein